MAVEIDLQIDSFRELRQLKRARVLTHENALRMCRKIVEHIQAEAMKSEDDRVTAACGKILDGLAQLHDLDYAEARFREGVQPGVLAEAQATRCDKPVLVGRTKAYTTQGESAGRFVQCRLEQGHTGKCEP